MRHDALTLLVARALQKAGFDIKMEQNGGKFDGRRTADVEVKDWASISDGKGNTSLADLAFTPRQILTPESLRGRG